MVKGKYSKPIFLIFLILLCSFAQFAVEGVAAETVDLTTDDGTKLKCTYFPSSMPNAPGIILLPDTRCDRMNFGSIPIKLNEAGFAVLAMDLRYKDIIAKARNRKEQIRTIQKQDLMALVKYDTKSGINFLSSKKEVDPKRIALIGTSLGSRVAIISGVEYDLKALVLISLSGEEAFPGYKPIKQLLSDYGEKPILFMTAKKDWGGNFKAAEHNKIYYDWKNGKKELKIWSGSGHGVGILSKKEAIKFVAAWLKSNI
ncbi:MAG: dienelactone hydrolase family protein [Desulfobacterales bacterium]|nr:MAG: dienelactone hydrolase family protein [Desulfobacterales bacterium]